MKSLRPSWTLILLLWLAFGLRVWGLGAESLWYDEAFSVYVARADLPTARDLLSQDFHPPLYYGLLRGAVSLFGDGEFAVRYLSVLSGLPLIPLMWVLARRLFPRSGRFARIAAALAAVAPFYLWYGREARMYSLTATLGLAATVALVQALERGSPRWYVALAGCALAAVYTHYSALYLVLGLGLYWLSQVVRFDRGIKLRRRHASPGAFAFGVVGLGVGLSLPHLSGFAQSARGFWPGRLDLGRALAESARNVLAGPVAPPALSIALLGAWGALAGLGLIAWWRAGRGRRAIWLLVCGSLIPALINFALLSSRPKFEPRHLMVLSPPLWLLCAAGMAEGWRRRTFWRRAAAGSVVGMLVVGVIYADGTILTSQTRDDWRAAVRHVKSTIAPDEALILVSGHAFPALWYYDAPAWVALPDDVLLDVTHTLNYPVVGRLNQTLRDKGGAWLLEWQAEVIDPTGVVPALLDELGAEQGKRPSFAGVGVRHFRFERAAHFPPRPAVRWRWEKPILPHLTFIGATPLPDPPLPADVPLTLRAFWQAAAPLPFGYRTSLRVRDSRGIEYARADYDLAGPRYSTNLWQVGAPVMAHYTATLPLGTPPGTYTPTLTVYRGEETFDTLPLGPVVVTRPLTLPAVSDLGLPRTGDERSLVAEGGIALVAAGFDQQTVTPCQSWHLNLAWRAATRPAQDFRLRLRVGADQVDAALAPDHPTTRWQPGDLWRTRHRVPIDCRALDGTAPVTARLLDADGHPRGEPAVLGEITVVAGRQFTLPDDLTERLDVRVVGVGTLAGYRLEKGQFRPGENLQVTLYWRAGQTIEQNYSVFVHLVNGGGTLAQHDGWPMEGQKPTTTWAREEVIVDRHVIPIGEDIPPGSYRLIVGMYDPANLENRPAFEPDGESIAGGRIELQTVTVKRP